MPALLLDYSSSACYGVGEMFKADPILIAKIRRWREVQGICQRLKPMLCEARKYETKELALRKEIGEALGDEISIVVDGKTLVHIKETRNNGIDYELAWNEALRFVSVRQRKKMLALLYHKIITIHKLAGE